MIGTFQRITNSAILILLGLIIASTLSCSTQTVEDVDTSDGAAQGDDFSGFDQAAGATASEDFGAEGIDTGDVGENAIESDIAQQNSGQAPAADADEFAQFETPAAEGAAEGGAAAETPPAVDPGAEAAAQTPVAEAAPPAESPAPADVPPPISESPAPPPEPGIADIVPPASTGQVVTLKSLQYRANDNGGTIVVEADGPMEYTTRMVSENGQFIIEIPNSKLPKKLKRPLNTKDFAGSIGSIDAYQNPGSTTSRVVVQLRSGEAEPTVQAEGNSLLVVTTPAPRMDLAASSAGGEASEPTEPADAGGPPSKLMSSDSLEEFIANNQTFYGKKISIETDDVEIREVFKLISDEANVNLILADEVRGKISVKLKNVPWDQALVLLMKSKKLGYTRSGNVIRISSIKDIRDEEKETLDLQASRRQNAVAKVKTISVNYAKVDDLVGQVKPMLTKTGSVVADARTSSLIVTDIEESIDRVTKVIQSIDVPPQQVLIEGKIVEAKEDIEKYFGINWGLRGVNGQTGGGARNTPLGFDGNVNIGQNTTSPSTFNFDFNLGTFDILGDLGATLRLFESEGKAKILSSPRIVAMQNEKANIEQSLEVPIRVSNVAAGGGVTQSVTFKEVKLLLEVNPQITNDGAVLMGVRIQREFLGPVVDLASGARETNRRLANTRVLVRNGQTAVIGGIYQNDMDQSQQRVPGISSLPVIGWLFKSQATTDKKNELLIFLTPRILGQLDSQAIPSQNGGDVNAIPELGL